MVAFFGTPGNDILTGRTSDDSLSGAGGNDTLNGGAGSDTMQGGTGDDVYIVDSIGDVVAEDDSIFGSSGIDTIRTTLTTASLDIFRYDTFDYVENLTYIGNGSAVLFDNSLDNILRGNGGDDTIESGSGFDTLRGFGGNDRLFHDGAIATPSSGQVTFEGGTGTDLLTLSQSGGGIISLNNASLSSIEQLQFLSDDGDTLQINIDYSQLGSLPFDALVFGGDGIDRLNVIASGAGDYQLPAFNLASFNNDGDPSTSDIVSLTGQDGSAYTLRAWFFQNAIQVLTGANMDDQLIGYFSSESLSGGAGNDTLDAGDSDDTLRGDAGNDVLLGGSGDDLLNGGANDDTLDAGDGDDSMTGGLGNDTFIVNGTGSKVITDFVSGSDQIDLSNTGIDSFAALQPLLSFSGGDAHLDLNLVGISATYTISGATSLSATDFIFAGFGNHVYYGTDDGDTLTATDNDFFLIGFGGDDTLIGSSGSDYLDGGTGDDSMVGGDGDDTYLVDSAGDKVVENSDSGTDTINTSLSSTSLSNYLNVENLTYNGGGNASLTGDVGDNVLTGSFGNDTLNGGDGHDTLHGGDGNDVLVRSGDFTGPFTFDGGSGFDTLSIFNTNNAVLQAGTINSIERIMFNAPSGGNMTIQVYFDQLGAGFPFNGQVVGSAGQDFFTVVTQTPGTYHLPNFTLTNWTTTANPTTSDQVAFAVAPTGDYTLYASAQHTELQVLKGNTGDDRLFGSAGNEILIGGGGADTLTPDDGLDTMTGGAGNDIFVADGNGIKLITDFELANDKLDLSTTGFNNFDGLQPFLSEVNGNTVLTAFPDGIMTSYTFQGIALASLSASNFIFSTDDAAVARSGSAVSELLNGKEGDDVLYGMSGNDTLNGFDGDDTLDGGLGDDRLAGGDGDDTYIVDSRNDVIVENGEGDTDTVQTALTAFGLTNLPEIENLIYTGPTNVFTTLTGNSLDNYIQGAGSSDKLSGGLGDDTLRGGTGNDTLTGGGGDDTFFLEGGGSHQINDFDTLVEESDFIGLSSTAYTALDQGPLDSEVFESGASLTTASNVDTRLIYDTTSGVLYYDADGSNVGSTPVAIVTLLGAPPLTAGDIFVDINYDP